MANKADRNDTPAAVPDVTPAPSTASSPDRVTAIDEHLASGIERASEGAQNAVTALEERSRAAIETARRKADEARRALERLERDAGHQVEQTNEDVTALIREKPLQAAGVAFAAGVLTTLLLRR